MNEEWEYRNNLQYTKNEIFQVLLLKNNVWLSIREIEDILKQRPDYGSIHIKIRDAIEDSMNNDKNKDEYQIVSNKLSIMNTNNTTGKYRLKTENINDKKQLEEYFQDKKCILYVNHIWFESCYPQMRQDIIALESEAKLLVSKGRDNKKTYIYINSNFANFQEKVQFKKDKRMMQMIDEAKSNNQETVASNQHQRQNQIKAQETFRRNTAIQNYWIAELQQELQRK
ncbi:unnamed protein product (macronuclear) [Paramecium tetraurelia]|uniref:BRCT domain-containing protein n=1 Tax=Paramecium tetraurelia TaxID=5888 RepID=A0D374_PARTE|nr:uncharacterized protein GSPATT00012976001 [Paramecium tetraurelia]CAK77491.1 unnamed protein product [Paramecium tetraurelia]|eukprot:XP_001444888.1 hypothetical protein (macronuclear) [Paramecium tetraurelia strain d4-2]